MINRVLQLLCCVVSFSVLAFKPTPELTTAEIRTLKTAVATLYYQQQIQMLQTNCDADASRYLTPAGTDDESAKQKFKELFVQKIQQTPAQIRVLHEHNPEFRKLTTPSSLKIPACDDKDALMDLAEQYSNKIISLEMSEPLASWLPYFTAVTNQGMSPDKLSALLSTSHSVVLVEIKPKSILTPMQQANFLHIDDKSSFVFEVQQGWKAIAPRYFGLHIYIDEKNYQQQPKRWLLLLDSRFYPQTVLHGAELQQAIQELGKEHWSFNRQGDLLRANK